MSHPDLDTIYALASGSGRSAIAVIRVGGRDTARVVATLCPLPAPRVAALRKLRDGAGRMLDEAVVIWRPGPASYTGEDAAELQVHGGGAVIRAVTDALNAAGARPAERGEFTKRACLNGKLDLLAAEAVGDLIDAETDTQRSQALRQLDGELSGVIEGWSRQLRHLLARQEAMIDFADEDLPVETESRISTDLRDLRLRIAAYLDDDRIGERLRNGLSIAVTGPPNVGKSSLVNALAGKDVAIVSPYAGTTRDALEARLDIGGVLVTVIDTAGIRETSDPVEQEGVRRARARAEAADILVRVSDPTSAVCVDGMSERPGIDVLNKVDLDPGAPKDQLGISTLTGAGLDLLRARLAAEIRRLTERSGPPPLTRSRHRSALLDAVRHLDAAQAACWPELRAEDIRSALQAVGRLVGWTSVEDVLDDVFREFCIGK